MEPILIDARKAREFVNVAAFIAADELRSADYRRGAEDVVKTMRLYLDALIDDPAGDRKVAA